MLISLLGEIVNKIRSACSKFMMSLFFQELWLKWLMSLQEKIVVKLLLSLVDRL
jgi:hypothetical protein